MLMASYQPDTTVLTGCTFGSKNRRQNLIQLSNRAFFNRKKETPLDDEKKFEKKEEAKQTETKEEEKQDETEPKQEEKSEPEAKQEESKEEPKEEPKEQKSSSSSDSEADEEKVSIKQWKALFAEQETEIESLQKEVEKMRKDLKAKDNEYKLVRIEYTKQVRENEDTVKRYRKMIEDEKIFAITKFAKNLLEVRDAMRMGLQNIDLDKIKGEEDLAKLKEHFESNVEGQQMTADVMDRVLGRFDLVQYDPVGEKFDPKLHEAVFTVPQSELSNDHVAICIQSGWKISDRVLRAAKVGIVKK